VLSYYNQALIAGPGLSMPVSHGWFVLDGVRKSKSIPAERAAIVQSVHHGEVQTWYLDGKNGGKQYLAGSFSGALSS